MRALSRTTDHVPPTTLEQRLSDGPLTVLETVRLAQGLFADLRRTHEAGTLHGDVRPANVVVDGPDATLVDAGREPRRAEDALATETVRYMAPERAGVIDRQVDERSDLYSAGAVLFECLVGRPLLGGSSLGAVLREHAVAGRRDPRELGASVPRAVAEVVARLLAADPGERYRSAAAVLGDLDDIAASLDRGEEEPAVVVGLHDDRPTLAEPAFVGRDHELSEFTHRLQRGEGGLLLLAGESGGGKTRLLDEFARGVGGRGWVLKGWGIDQAAQQPFEVLSGVVEGILDAVAEDELLAGRLRQSLGELGDAVSAAVPDLAPVLGPATTKLGPEAFGEQRTLDALSALLSALGSVQRPAIVLLDDCQWADELTLKLLVHWRRIRAERDHTLVVAAFRSEEVGGDHPLRRAEATTVELPPLAVADIRTLGESMAGPLPSRALDLLVQLSEGSPFMASAVVHGLVETGALVRESPSGWAVDEMAMADVEASRRAATLLAQRLKLLGRPVLSVLETAAVLGKEFDPDLVADLQGRPRSDVRELLAEGRRRHILWSRDERWAFVHDKLRQVVLEHISPDERRRLHLLAARHLEEHHRDRTFDLAYHFDAAGESDHALPYALAAAEQARSRHALDVAQQQYEIAERGVREIDTELSRRITEGLGDVLMLHGSYDAATEKLEAARQMCPDRVCEAELAVKLGDLAFKRGDLGRAREELERGIRVLGRWRPKRSVTFLLAAVFELIVQAAHTLLPRIFCARRDREGAHAEFVTIRLYSRLTHVYWFAKGTIPTLWAHLREMNLAERYPPSPELAQAYSEHAPAMSLIPYYARGARYGQRSLEIRRDLGDLWGQGQSLSFLGVLAYAASRFEECVDHCRQAARLLARTGDRWEQSTAQQHIALALYRLGDLGGAADVAEHVYQSGVEVGDAQARSVALDAWSKATNGGVPAELVHAEIERPTFNVQLTAEALQAEAVRQLAIGRPLEAIAGLQRARRVSRAAGLRQEYVAPILPWLATALRSRAEETSRCNPRDYRRLLRRGRRTARRARMVAYAYRNNLAHALRESGHLAAMSGRPRRAQRFLERSQAAAARYGMRYEQAQTAAVLARLRRELDQATAEDVARAEEALAVFSSRPDELEGVTPSLVDRFDTVLDAGRTIASALTPDTIHAATHEAVLAVLRAERCVVLEMSDGPGTLGVVAGHTLGEFSHSLARRALLERKAVLLSDEAAEESESVVLAGVRSALCAPILVRGQVVAFLYAEHRKLAGLFGPDEERLATFIATIAGAALENAEGFAEIQELTRTLEHRVRERTKELGDSNRRLDESLRRLTDAYEEGQALTERLKLLDELKTDFMAMTAHDLRSPLTVISGYVSLISEDWSELDDEEKRSMIERIGTATKRMNEFIENMLQFARIESGELSYDIRPFDLGALATKVTSEFDEVSPGRFGVTIEPGLPLALGDEQRNWQVITNLLSNADKFSPPDQPIELEISRRDDHLQVSVRDRGPGISAEDRGRLFRKFTRLQQPTGRSKGTGLGLYICRSIVEAQGGRIWVDSEPGVGATFSYTIPLAEVRVGDLTGVA